jgi:hypothetical protein
LGLLLLAPCGLLGLLGDPTHGILHTLDGLAGFVGGLA